MYTPNYGANTTSLFTRAVGAGAVNVSSNVASSWTITGPATINGSGTSQSNPSEPTGTYTINWGNVPGYSTPSTQSLTLSASGSSISFNANYLPLSCSSQTINNCDLPTTASGNTAGSCAAGFSNSCTYSCTAGVWTLSSNTCGPTATLSASPTTISSGQFSTLKWSSPNAISCTSLGGFSTGGATSGTATVSPVSTSNYEISCTGAGSSLGHSNIASVTVVVANISITAIPTRVVKGGSTTVSWNATSVSACEITKNGSPWKSYTAVSGTVSGSSVENNINAQTTYIMSCVTPASPVYIPSTPLIVNIPSILNQF